MSERSERVGYASGCNFPNLAHLSMPALFHALPSTTAGVFSGPTSLAKTLHLFLADPNPPVPNTCLPSLLFLRP